MSNVQKAGSVPLALCPGLAPTVLPELSAVVGPCSPTAAIWLALGYLEVAALPLFETAAPRNQLNETPHIDDDGTKAQAENASEQTTKANRPTQTEPKPKPRALIITGPRHKIQAEIDAEDEPLLRNPISSLDQIDVRYCPTWRHALLLLSLLSQDLNPSSAELVQRPGLIVLADLLGLFENDEDKENEPPDSATGVAEGTQGSTLEAGRPSEGGSGGVGGLDAGASRAGGGGGDDGEGTGGRGEGKDGEEERGERKLGPEAWNYLSLISSAKSAADHLGAALVVLEHREAELPLPAPGSGKGRGRSIELKTGLEKILGHAVTITRLPANGDSPTHDDRAHTEHHSQRDKESRGQPDEELYEVIQTPSTFLMARHPVQKHEYALPPPEARTGDEEVAWEWTWV